MPQSSIFSGRIPARSISIRFASGKSIRIFPSPLGAESLFISSSSNIFQSFHHIFSTSKTDFPIAGPIPTLYSSARRHNFPVNDAPLPPLYFLPFPAILHAPPQWKTSRGHKKDRRTVGIIQSEGHVLSLVYKPSHAGMAEVKSCAPRPQSAFPTFSIWMP